MNYLHQLPSAILKMGLGERESSLDEFVFRASSAPRIGRHNSPGNALNITVHHT
jgi:hypothetical protein